MSEENIFGLRKIRYLFLDARGKTYRQNKA